MIAAMRFRETLACLATVSLCALASEALAQTPAPAAPPPAGPAQPPSEAPPSGTKPEQPPAGQQPKGAPPAVPPAAVPPGAAPSAGAEPPQPDQAPPAATPEATPPAELAADAASPAQPPPLQQQPNTAATLRPAPATRDSGKTPEVQKPTAPPETTLGIEADVGMNGRLGSGNEGFDTEDPAGIAYALGAWLAPDRVYSVGLAYQRTGLGSGQTEPVAPSVTAQYDLNTIWLGGRAYPLRNDHVGMFLQIMVGGSWQDIHASGTRATAEFGTPAETFSCSVSDGPGLSLSGGIGVDVDIDSRLAFVASAEGGGHQQSGELVDGCTLGVGSVTTVSGRIGFMYRFDLDGESAGAARATRGTSARR